MNSEHVDKFFESMIGSILLPADKPWPIPILIVAKDLTG